MKTRAETQKHLVLTLLVLVIICVSACQPTPEKEIIQQRDDFDELVQKTAQPTNTTEPEVDNSEPQPTNSDEPQPTETIEPLPKYQETLEFEDSAFKVVIDAVIDEPDGPIPVAKVEPYVITQEDVDRALELLMPNQKLYQLDCLQDFGARDILQKQIFKLETLIAEIKGDETLDEQTRRSLIGIHVAGLCMLEKRILNQCTIDSLPCIEATTELKESANNWKTVEARSDMGKSLFGFFVARSAENGSNLINFVNKDFDFQISSIKRINSDIPGMKTTYNEAKELAENSLKQLGLVDNISLVYTELGAYRAVPDEDWIATEYIPKRYMFYFASEINGIQAPNIQICRGFEQDGNQDYDYRWGDEYIFVAVDDTGIVVLVHAYPGEVTEIVNDNVEVIDFEEALEIFKKQIFYEGVWTGQGVAFSKLNITKIQLSMFRLRLKDKNEYMYIPVWDFIGTWKTNNYGTEEGQELSFLTINAIDGSIISRDLGY